MGIPYLRLIGLTVSRFHFTQITLLQSTGEVSTLVSMIKTRCGFTRNEMEGNPPLSRSEDRIEDNIEDKWLKDK